MGPDVPLVLAAVLEEVGVAVGTLLSPLHHHRSALQGRRVCPAHIHTVSVANPQTFIALCAFECIRTLASSDIKTEVRA